MNLNPPYKAREEDEEDSDYDVFASVRPKGMAVDDNPQDQADGEEIDELAHLRPRGIYKLEDQKPNKKFSQAEENVDYAKQYLKETLINLGGTYGDLGKMIGLGSDELLPEEKAKYSRELKTLKKMESPNDKPSFAEIYDLSDDDIAPPLFTPPTTKKLREVNKFAGGPGEPKTPSGKYGKRQGALYGAGLAFGQGNPLPSFGAGAIGELTEEATDSPLAATVAEIITLLATQGRSRTGSAIKSTEKAVQDKIDKLRELGYSEEQIALAVNSASKGKKFGITASKGARTEQAFEDFAEHSDDLVKSILETEIPGVEKGVKKVHELASDAYGKVIDDASKLNITKLDPFLDKMKSSLRDIEKNLGHSAEAKAFMKEITEHTMDIIKNPTAENMIDFYKRLNGMGKWMSRNQKDRIITNVKDSIKDTFKAEGKSGKELADKFEKVNAGIKKAYDAEDLMKFVNGAKTQDGLDYNKLYKVFDKDENVKLFQQVLGKDQTKNLRFIAQQGKEIKNFDKAWKVTNLFKGNSWADIARGGFGSYYLWKGDMEGLTYVLASKGLGASGKKIAEKLLTDPKYQNLYIKGLNALKNASPIAFKSADNAMKKYLEKQDIELD